MHGMTRKILYFLIFVLLSNIVFAATIHGTVYSLYLEKQENAVVTVDSIPKQTYVAKDASYFFELTTGDYNVTAVYKEGNLVKAEATESISIEKQGDYVVDLILFPVFYEEEEILKETEEIDIDDEYFKDEISTTDIILFIIAVAGLGFVIYLILKYKKVLTEVSKEVEKTAKEVEKTKVPDESKDVIDFIKKKGRRVTQKEIRKNFPSSEAKVSLIISDLEDKGIVKKIKKGRGNIIFLK